MQALALEPRHDLWAFKDLRTDATWSAECLRLFEHDGLVTVFVLAFLSVVPVSDRGVQEFWKPPIRRGRGARCGPPPVLAIGSRDEADEAGGDPDQDDDNPAVDEDVSADDSEPGGNCQRLEDSV